LFILPLSLSLESFLCKVLLGLLLLGLILGLILCSLFRLCPLYFQLLVFSLPLLQVILVHVLLQLVDMVMKLFFLLLFVFSQVTLAFHRFMTSRCS